MNRQAVSHLNSEAAIAALSVICLLHALFLVAAFQVFKQKKLTGLLLMLPAVGFFTLLAWIYSAGLSSLFFRLALYDSAISIGWMILPVLTFRWQYGKNIDQI